MATDTVEFIEAAINNNIVSFLEAPEELRATTACTFQFWVHELLPARLCDVFGKPAN